MLKKAGIIILDINLHNYQQDLLRVETLPQADFG